MKSFNEDDLIKAALSAGLLCFQRLQLFDKLPARYG
jgi:hypothetical protein